MGRKPYLNERKNSMALVIDLKPGEKILIGEAVITNDSQRTRLHIAGDAPILREKDVMQERRLIRLARKFTSLSSACIWPIRPNGITKNTLRLYKRFSMLLHLRHFLYAD